MPKITKVWGLPLILRPEIKIIKIEKNDKIGYNGGEEKGGGHGGDHPQIPEGTWKVCEEMEWLERVGGESNFDDTYTYIPGALKTQNLGSRDKKGQKQTKSGGRS